jgi:hypothetical protein
LRLRVLSFDDCIFVKRPEAEGQLLIESHVTADDFIGDGLEHPFENPGFHPVSEPREHGVLVAKHRRQIPPRTARSRDPQDRFEEKPAVSAGAPRISWFTQTMRLHAPPLGISRDESIHAKLL